MASKRANRLAPLRMTRAPAPVACPNNGDGDAGSAVPALLLLHASFAVATFAIHRQWRQSVMPSEARPPTLPTPPPLLLFASLSFSPSLCCSLPPSASFFPFLPLFCQFRFWFSKFVLQNGCTCKQMPRPPFPLPSLRASFGCNCWLCNALVEVFGSHSRTLS